MQTSKFFVSDSQGNHCKVLEMELQVKIQIHKYVLFQSILQILQILQIYVYTPTAGLPPMLFFQIPDKFSCGKFNSGRGQIIFIQ